MKMLAAVVVVMVRVVVMKIERQMNMIANRVIAGFDDASSRMRMRQNRPQHEDWNQQQ